MPPTPAVRTRSTVALLALLAWAAPAAAQAGDSPVRARNALYGTATVSSSVGFVGAVFDHRLPIDVTLYGGIVKLVALQGDIDHLLGRTTLAVPLGTSLLRGCGSHHVEAGVGVVLMGQSVTGHDGVTWGPVMATGTFGYRYQRARGGVVLRAGATPLVGGPPMQFGGYASVGWAHGTGPRRPGSPR